VTPRALSSGRSSSIQAQAKEPLPAAAESRCARRVHRQAQLTLGPSSRLAAMERPRRWALPGSNTPKRGRRPRAPPGAAGRAPAVPWPMLRHAGRAPGRGTRSGGASSVGRPHPHLGLVHRLVAHGVHLVQDAAHQRALAGVDVAQHHEVQPGAPACARFRGGRGLVRGICWRQGEGRVG
jgi:hypothetical protein